ncbi:uncharacterized protein LOC131949610 [Physella acuta]|uniref:uncharacterized protein LOC131949610 n=1 Tax=Physella acuta TaxID=109671 RepID=UPI0027DC586F|nr:uncharacterized protein LOC131949610 [Physella acuta]
MAATTRKQRAKKTVDKSLLGPVTEEDRLPGVVYIGHVPHGFYERQLSSYFSQFGKVLNVKLSRSKKNGKSKGYAFVKFKYAAVAKTVAETCHNYLFFNKLLKCEYKPMSEVHENTFFKFKWRPTTKPKRQHNSAKTTEKLDESLRRSARNQSKKLEKLKEFGIDLKLEDIMDVPKIPKKQPKKKSKETPTPKE